MNKNIRVGAHRACVAVDQVARDLVGALNLVTRVNTLLPVHVSDPVALFLLTWAYKPCRSGWHLTAVRLNSPDSDKHALRAHVYDQLQLTFRASTS